MQWLLPGQREIQEVYKLLNQKKVPPPPAQDIEMAPPESSQNPSKENQPAGGLPESGQIIFLSLLKL